MCVVASSRLLSKFHARVIARVIYDTDIKQNSFTFGTLDGAASVLKYARELDLAIVTSGDISDIVMCSVSI